MDDVTEAPNPKRGMSASQMRSFICKDCQREVEQLQERLIALESGAASKQETKKLRSELHDRKQRATYNENWARNLVERGGSRSDRCKEHRYAHKINIQGLAVAYIDLQTVGEVADRDNPTGPLGGLGPLPISHEVVPKTFYDLQDVPVGMTDAHVATMIDLLREKQVLILKAGTGTGKSTFAPYRLMDPPPATLADVPSSAAFAKLTDLGPIIVTEPRVQAAVGVASFVGRVMSGSGGVGPGYPVGYQVSGDRNHDEACELIYVTDGTMINWLREGRLSRIGTVIVDEAHERSTNIDFIMGYLKRELPRYPHLRVIVTSATFNTGFYQEYFGGDSNVNVMEIPPEKAFGYGMPLFPNLDEPEDGEHDIAARWTDPSLPLANQNPRDDIDFIRTHWRTQYAEPLRYPADVTEPSDDGYTEDVWATTQRIMHLRWDGKVPMEQWQERMPSEMAKFVIQLAKELDAAGIFGDILGFLPTRRTIEPVCDEIERALGRGYKDQVFPLISTLPKDQQRKALAKRRKGDPRKIVISTNLAETSLTVEGVRFVVDSGIIAQSEWDPDLAKGGIPTKPHSQAGIKQRWGRVGRKAPGWVFPLYTKGQFVELAEDTPPGSTRENLEALVMTAKMGGIDDVRGFDWPAAFQPQTVALDRTAVEARTTFIRELERADQALRAGGAVDGDGHPTSFGKELMRFQGLGSTASAMAIMYADRLACVPEVATVLALLEDTRLVGQRGLLLDDYQWPDEWRLEAAERHRGIASLCADDAELVLLTASAWERADPDSAPWEDSPARQEWSRMWWVNHATLLEAARLRHDVVSALSPAMKEDVKRFLEPALIGRIRGVLTRALASHIFERTGDGQYRAGGTPYVRAKVEPADTESDGVERISDVAGQPPAASTLFALEDDLLLKPIADHVIALRRRESKRDNRISSLVIAQPWAITDDSTGEQSSVADAMRMVVAAALAAPAEPIKTRALRYIESWPVGRRVRIEVAASDEGLRIQSVSRSIPPFPRPKSREELDADHLGGNKARVRRKGNALRLVSDDLGGTAEDVHVELRVDARTGDNDDAIANAELLAIDAAADFPAACGQCFSCLDDRPEDCEQPSDSRKGGKGEDPVVSWRRRAEDDGSGVFAPRVDVEEQPFDSDGWFEVIQYRRDGDAYVVMLRPDWRRGQPGSAGQHPDLRAGDAVEVRVARRLQHHGGYLRAFDRIDGNGRFILAEASSRYADAQEKRREIAVSLDRGNTLLLDHLTDGGIVTATVVPARAEGTVTITLLELLHQHWSRCQDGRGAENHVLDKTRRNARTTKVFSAIVEQPPNTNGYATARLLHQDEALGIVHRFDVNVLSKKSDSPHSQTEVNVDDSSVFRPQLTVGDAILLNLVSDRASLDVTGLDVGELLEIEGSSARQLQITGLPDDWNDSHSRASDAARRDEREDLEPTDRARDVAPPGTLIKANTDRPLPRSAAIRLVQLSDEPDWPNVVWAFWARSHHLRVGDRPAFIPGSAVAPINVSATVSVNTQTPIAQQRAMIEVFGDKHPVHSIVECIVRSLTKAGVFVELENPLEGFIPLAELSWASHVSHPDLVIQVGDRVQALVTEIPEPPDTPQLSIKALTADPYTAFKKRHTIGDRVAGSVNKVIPSFAFIDLGDDVDGAIHVSELDHSRVESADAIVAEGDTVDAVILDFEDDKRRVRVSRKATIPAPYEVFKARHSVGDKVRATVNRATPSRVYLTHSNGAVGVVHVSNLAWERVADASSQVVVGTELTAEIVKFNDDRQQIELSRKAVLPHPYESYKARHSVGDKVRATVNRATPSLVYLTHSNGAVGVVHVSNLAWERVADASSQVVVGTELTAEIVKFNDDRQQIELSRKAILPKPYPAFKQVRRVGEIVSGIVTNTIPAMVFVDLGAGVQGTIHVSQLAPYRVGHPDEIAPKGQRVSAAIVGFDDARERVQLSVKATGNHSGSVPTSRPPITPQPTYAPPKPVQRSITADGLSVEEAVAFACRQLGITIRAARIEVLDPGEQKRLFRAGRPARVRVTTTS